MSRVEKRMARLASYWLAVIAAALLPSVVLAHDAAPRPEMLVAVDRFSFGKTIKNGRYEYAIEKLTAPGRSDRNKHIDQINLCVAYAKSHRLELAEAACEYALALVRDELAATARDDERVQLARYEAVALSNLGVVRVAIGDYDSAERDFRDALDVSRSVRAPVRNLAYLETRRTQESK